LEQIYVNGRFTTQALSGVQRFASEITFELQRAQADRIQVITPSEAPDLRNFKKVGRLGGQAWEQWELPRHTNDGILLNLGNTAPVWGRNQILVIHDTGVFSTPEAYSWRFRSWYKAMQQILVSRGTQILTVSEFARGEIIKHLHAKPEQVVVIPEGADHVNRITSDPSVLEKHGLTPGKYVLAVGTLAAHKNLQALRPLAACLAKRGVNLVIAGGMGSRAFQQADKSQLPDPALYIGRVTDGELKALYQAAGCFIFPSKYEGYGLPAVEAMACGCPVVAADIPALKESCGGAAVFFNPRDPEDLSAKVLKLIDDEPLQNRLRREGYEHTRKTTWHEAVRSLEDIISQYRMN
jgi:glycosyltransferase involved in cell wall biosynthesis